MIRCELTNPMGLDRVTAWACMKDKVKKEHAALPTKHSAL